MQKKWLIGGGLSLVLGIGGALAWVSGVIPSQAGETMDKVDANAAAALSFAPREVVRPQRGPMPERIEFSGPLVAPGTAVLKAKAAGTLINLAAAEGDRVRAGQQLGRLDLADASSRVAERSANVAAARAVLAQAERSHAQNQRLAAQQFISAAALDSSRSAVETAQAQLNAAIASADLARVGLRDATLVAPIDGIVAKRHVLPGEKVSPEQPVLTLVDLRRLELAGVVGTHEVSRLAVDMPVSVQVEGMQRPVDGRIARIAPAAEPGTRSIGVTIVLDNPKETLRAGQYAVASATLDDDLQRLSVPVAAVAQTSGQDHVWVIDDGVLARRAVRLGRRDARGARVEILSGLAADSMVLAARFDKLVEGAKASVLVDKIPAVASAAASAPLQ
jgi:RND family efflux transporter MFP subunit